MGVEELEDFEVISAARTIRVELRTLLGDDADDAGPRLDGMLVRAEQGDGVADEMLALLAADERTRRRLEQLLPDVPDGVRSGYIGLPGLGQPSAEIVYRCNICGYEYPIFEVGEFAPTECPNGHGRLQRAR
jgi:rubrerythrin